MLTKNDLNQIGQVIRDEVKPIKTDVSKVRKDIDVMLLMFDQEYIDLRRRVEKIEEHLGFPRNQASLFIF